MCEIMCAMVSSSTLSFNDTPGSEEPSVVFLSFYIYTVESGVAGISFVSLRRYDIGT